MGKLSTFFSHLKKNGLRSTLASLFETLRDKRLHRLKQKYFPKIDQNPLRNKIVFECESDMDDNPRAVYEHMIARGLNEQYEIVWLVKDAKYCNKHYAQKNVSFVNRFDKSKKNQLKLRYHLSTAKWFLFSHPYWFEKIKPKQIVIHTGHGTPLKDRGKQDVSIDHTFDKMLVASEGTKDLYVRFWQCPEEKTFICGNPRNDLLLGRKV